LVAASPLSTLARRSTPTVLTLAAQESTTTGGAAAWAGATAPRRAAASASRPISGVGTRKA
jgi:hypothetical protein